MKTGDLYTKSLKIYRKNGIISHILHFLLGALASGFVLLGLFYVDLFLLIVPVIVIPLIFTAQIATILLRDQEVITVAGLFNCIKSFYSNKFNSTYRIFRSFLFSLAIGIGFSIIYGLVVNLSLYSVNYMNYQGIANDFIEHINTSVEELQLLINKYEPFFSMLLIITSTPTLFVFCFSFLFISSKHAVSLFDRLDKPELDGRINKMVQENIIRNNRKEYEKLFTSLNWPLYVLFILGFGAGALLGYITLGTYTAVFILGLSIAIFVSFGLYGPFLLANNETLYLYFKLKYDLETDMIRKKYKTTIEQLMQKLEDEDEKKDSDES